MPPTRSASRSKAVTFVHATHESVWTFVDENAGNFNKAQFLVRTSTCAPNKTFHGHEPSAAVARTP